MKKESKEALEAYYAEGDSWAKDRQDALLTSRRIAWIVAGIALFVAALEAIALIVLTPLKTVEPYTLLVDRQTGFVQALKPLDVEKVSADAALTQSFLAQYVIAREGFDINAVQSDYRKVALWSAGHARRDYLAQMQATHPESPFTKYPRSTIVDTRVKSVTPLSRDTAMVRYDSIRRDAGGAVSAPQPWMAVVTYAYSGEPMNIADRMINPLGFKVSRFRRSMEALAPAEPRSATSAAPYVGAAPQGPAATAPQPGVPDQGVATSGRANSR